MHLVAQVVLHGAEELGLDLPPGAVAAFGTYYDFLEKHGRSMNLTAITGAHDVARLHFLDSLSLLSAADFKSARIIDVGSGAGFPGIPIKLAEPSVELTLLDATGKRVAFLLELCAVLGINAACVHARAEEASRRTDMREQFDIALSRAVARLNTLCELCLPFVRVGGKFLAMKSVDSAEELFEARNAMSILGAEHENNFDYSIPGTDIVHRAVIIRKSFPAPIEYPRRFAKIQKFPL